MATTLEVNNFTLQEWQDKLGISCLEDAVKQVITDSGLPVLSKRAMEQFVLPEKVRQAYEQGKPVSLIAMDLDYFKKINDTYGHLAGDEVLKHFVNVCKTNIRSRDKPGFETREKDILAQLGGETVEIGRIGGEEFAVLLYDVSAGRAYEVAERLRKAVEKTPAITRREDLIFFTISLGVAAVEPEMHSEMTIDDASRALRSYADTALYKAKETRNTTTVFGSRNCITHPNGAGPGYHLSPSHSQNDT